MAAEMTMDTLAAYKNDFESGCAEFLSRYPDTELYAPVRYLMGLGGKRLRPALVLAACEACGGEKAQALPAALAVELFHNFTLMHDDIMDDAPLRRGQPTVHEKWDANTAILSGDALHVIACEALLNAPHKALPELLRVFHRTALEVCEGQEQDMAFESRSDVELEDYMEMIRLKTSVLLAAALDMGGASAGADTKVREALYEFGLHVGLAFQLQDDYLDAFGNPENFGKQVGGDILADKKTFLLIRALEKAHGSDLEALLSELGIKREGKVERVLDIYRRLGVDAELRDAMAGQVALAEGALVRMKTIAPQSLPGSEAAMALLHGVAAMVTARLS
ncbi:MAG: polyprenyl synthetase family protein [Flavobacteriales bacterium]|nr:polyprenyl synthetase family protein [Flavobacteriales bacterium]